MVPRAAAVLLLALLAGCGSASRDELPPAAEPASSPRPAAAPDGRIVDVGFKPEGVVADPIAGIFAVGVREPAELMALLAADESLRTRWREAFADSGWEVESGLERWPTARRRAT